MLRTMSEEWRVGIGIERVQLATFVGWPAPNWNDWIAEAREDVLRGRSMLLKKMGQTHE